MKAQEYEVMMWNRVLPRESTLHSLFPGEVEDIDTHLAPYRNEEEDE